MLSSYPLYKCCKYDHVISVSLTFHQVKCMVQTEQLDSAYMAILIRTYMYTVKGECQNMFVLNTIPGIDDSTV